MCFFPIVWQSTPKYNRMIPLLHFYCCPAAFVYCVTHDQDAFDAKILLIIQPYLQPLLALKVAEDLVLHASEFGRGCMRERSETPKTGLNTTGSDIFRASYDETTNRSALVSRFWHPQQTRHGPEP